MRLRGRNLDLAVASLSDGWRPPSRLTRLTRCPRRCQVADWLLSLESRVQSLVVLVVMSVEQISKARPGVAVR